MTATCPVCHCDQPDGLLCPTDVTKLEQALGDVRWIVTELDTTLSRQARIGVPGKGGLAREKNPIHMGALTAADTLSSVLVVWARAMMSGRDTGSLHSHPALAASCVLRGYIDEIRRHPDVDKLVHEVTDAINQAKRAIDRPADRAYLGQCLTAFEGDADDGMCFAEIWARVDAKTTTCRTCGITHNVLERRRWLLNKAADMLVTSREASRYLGDVGGINVTEASIRGLLHRGKLGYRTGTTFRLGDLLDVLTDMRAAA
jgi:hypothetical protein